jgi:poly(3-hydroxyalkanoate) synthetase
MDGGRGGASWLLVAGLERWLAEISGKQVRARKPGDGPLAAIEDAPGSYVRVKSITG